MTYRCTGCNSTGFALSRLGVGRCEFCDGTEGGNPPTDEEVECAILGRRRVAVAPTVNIYSTGTTLVADTAIVRPATRHNEWRDAKAWGQLFWLNDDNRWDINGWVRGLIRDVHNPLHPIHSNWDTIY